MTCILFNLCGSPGFYHGVRIKEIECTFFILRLPAEKSAFLRCLIQNLEEIDPRKNEKSPGKVLEFCFPISVQTLFKQSIEHPVCVLIGACELNRSNTVVSSWHL